MLPGCETRGQTMSEYSLQPDTYTCTYMYVVLLNNFQFQNYKNKHNIDRHQYKNKYKYYK